MFQVALTRMIDSCTSEGGVVVQDSEEPKQIVGGDNIVASSQNLLDQVKGRFGCLVMGYCATEQGKGERPFRLRAS